MSTTLEDRLSIEKRGMELEYVSIRGEILKRIELRQQIVAVTLTLAGIFLGIGITTETVALIYPVLATFLALGWGQNDFRVRDLATYQRENIESLFPGIKYETRIHQNRRMKDGSLGSWRFVVLSHGGIFLLTQFMAIVIEFSKFTFNLLEYILLGIDVLSMVLVIWVIRQSKR